MSCLKSKKAKIRIINVMSLKVEHYMYNKKAVGTSTINTEYFCRVSIQYAMEVLCTIVIFKQQPVANPF